MYEPVTLIPLTVAGGITDPLHKIGVGEGVGVDGKTDELTVSCEKDEVLKVSSRAHTVFV